MPLVLFLTLAALTSLFLVGNMEVLDPIMPDNNGLLSRELWNLQTGTSSELSILLHRLGPVGNLRGDVNSERCFNEGLLDEIAYLQRAQLLNRTGSVYLWPLHRLSLAEEQDGWHPTDSILRFVEGKTNFLIVQVSVLFAHLVIVRRYLNVLS